MDPVQSEAEDGVSSSGKNFSPENKVLSVRVSQIFALEAGVFECSLPALEISFKFKTPKSIFCENIV